MVMWGWAGVNNWDCDLRKKSGAPEVGESGEEEGEGLYVPCVTGTGMFVFRDKCLSAFG